MIRPLNRLLLLVLLQLPQGGPARALLADPSLTDHFVQIVDGEFVLGCNRFPISGWN
jgi:hypothetical protein